MTTLVIHPPIVARSLARLREQKTHTLFAGYLCLQQRATQLERLENLRPDFKQFYKRFFEVSDHPLGTPYIKIFTEQKPSLRNLWLNENVAGSYAPSSLRPKQPFRQVVQIENREYSLPSDHAPRALEHLLYGNRVQAADLAIVLYRDYGFSEDITDIFGLVRIFAYEFGYSDKYGTQLSDSFQLLFSTENVSLFGDDWLEAL